jgi:undecaprenyl-diphosphatase
VPAEGPRARPHPIRLLGEGVLLLLVVWGCGALVRAHAGSVDLTAVRDLAALRDGTLTTAARALSLLGSGYVVFPLAMLSGLLLFIGHRRREALLILTSTFGAVAIENIDKLLVGRPRPPVRHLELVTSPSFPSGHATQSAAFYGSGLLALVILLRGPGSLRRFGRSAAAAALAVLVCGVCFSRVYLGVHYPTDVACGLLLGALWAGLVRRELAAAASPQTISQP